eukprot:scaffold2479_cov153-Skeletonema_menzelii.AAC.6
MSEFNTTYVLSRHLHPTCHQAKPRRLCTITGGSRLFSVSIKSENRKRRMIDFVDEAASTARSLSLLGGVVCTAATMRR